MLFVPDDVAVKQNRVGDYNLPVASQEIFVVQVQRPNQNRAR